MMIVWNPFGRSGVRISLELPIPRNSASCLIKRNLLGGLISLSAKPLNYRVIQIMPYLSHKNQ
ncbi:hypothetical protein I7I48_10182 [Histoplasma ohiense]|nr:hypothetical protein I7I48_10182 [Histoplasma ohiense (nom. inval.)]